MILGLQIIAIVFSFMMIYFALLHRKRKEIDKSEYISWIAIWSVTIFIVIFPELLRSFAQRFLITRLFDLMVVAAFILVITMVVRVYVKTRKMENKFEEFIREESLKNADKKKK